MRKPVGLRYRLRVAAEQSRRTGSRPAAADTLTRGRIGPAEDAPIEPAHEGDSVQLLVAALRDVDPATLSSAVAQLADEPQTSPATRAVIEALGQLAGDKATGRTHSSRKIAGGEPPVTAALVKRLAAIALVFLTLIEPVATQLSGRVFGPSTELADVVEGQKQLQATVLAIAKWTVDAERARAAGQPMPEPPAPIKLILVQDEMAQGHTSP